MNTVAGRGPTSRRRLLERSGAFPAGSPTRVDREAGVIRGVKVLGRKSSNGREYLPETIRQAARLYEGAPVRINHPDSPDDQRRAEDTFGWLRDVRIGENGNLYADLHYLKSHPMAERICESADRNQSLVGLSHNAEGEVEQRDGRLVVTRIYEVRSVDLVADPATTTGLFESRSRSQPRPRSHSPKRTSSMRYTLKEWFDRTRLLRPARKKITRLFEMGYMAPDQAMQEAEGDEPPMAGDDTEPVSAGPLTPDADPADMDPEEALRQGFRAACVAVLDDGTLDVKAKVSRLKELLTAADNLIGSGQEIPEADDGNPDDKKGKGGNPISEGDDKDADDAGELMEQGDEGCDMGKKKVTESKELRLLRAEKHARRLCEEAGVLPTVALLEALSHLPDDARRTALIEEHRQPRRAVGASAAALTEQGRKGAKAGSGPLGEPADAKEFADRLFNRG